MKLKFYLRGLGIGIAVTALVMSVLINKTQTVEMTDDEVIARAETLGMVMEDKLLVNPSNNVSNEQEGNNGESESADNNQSIMMEPESTGEDTSSADVQKTEEDASESNEADEAAKEEAIKKAEEEAKKLAEEEAKKAEEEAKKAEEEAKKKAEEEAKKKAEEEAKKKAEEEAKKKAEEEAKKKAEEEAKKKAEEEAKKKAEEEAKKKAEQAAATPVSIPVEGTVVTINVTAGSGSEKVSEQLYKAGLVSSAAEFNAYLCAGGYDRRLTTGNHNVIAGSSYAEIAKVMTASTKK